MEEDPVYEKNNSETEQVKQPGCDTYKWTPPECPLFSYCTYPNCGGCSNW